MGRGKNYSTDRDTQENFNVDDRYSVTGESEYSRESTIPYDEDEVLSERHYNLGGHSSLGQKRLKRRSDYQEELNHHGKGPRGYTRSDSRIREDVCEALYRSTDVDATEIEVEVSRGEVYLRGFVSTRIEKKRAEEAVEFQAGVTDVHNQLIIQEKGHDVPLGKKGLMNNITGMN